MLPYYMTIIDEYWLRLGPTLSNTGELHLDQATWATKGTAYYYVSWAAVNW